MKRRTTEEKREYLRHRTLRTLKKFLADLRPGIEYRAMTRRDEVVEALCRLHQVNDPKVTFSLQRGRLRIIPLSAAARWAA